MVQPRRSVRADFEVLPLSTIEGTVTGPEGAARDGIVIHMLPGPAYTLTTSDGHFAFYNVREGDFNLVIDPATLPEDAKLLSDPSLPVVVGSEPQPHPSCSPLPSHRNKRPSARCLRKSRGVLPQAGTTSLVRRKGLFKTRFATSVPAIFRRGKSMSSARARRWHPANRSR